MTTPEDDAFAERMQGEPQVGDASLDELLEVFGEEAVAGMSAAGQLTPQQYSEWESRLPAAPPYGEPLPPSEG